MRRTTSSLDLLRDRAAMFARSRHFFESRSILEVDCPSITQAASIDLHIDLIPVLLSEQEKRYLISSPEYGMKRLLSEGIGDIYQMSHVYRMEEVGAKHNPEFMMVEWYRVGISFEEMIDETFEYISLFLGNRPRMAISYRNAFLEYTGIDYTVATPSDLMAYIQEHTIPYYNGIFEEGKDALLNLILATHIEPHLGREGLCALTHYPASQSALAKTLFHGDEPVAERFEVYFQGVELANGYHELIVASEQRKRFEESNIQRVKFGKPPYPIDEKFLEALHHGMPDCCGVAVGFDRLMQLRHGRDRLEEILPFGWDSA